MVDECRMDIETDEKRNKEQLNNYSTTSKI